VRKYHYQSPRDTAVVVHYNYTIVAVVIVLLLIIIAIASMACDRGKPDRDDEWMDE